MESLHQPSKVLQALQDVRFEFHKEQKAKTSRTVGTRDVIAVAALR